MHEHHQYDKFDKLCGTIMALDYLEILLGGFAHNKSHNDFVICITARITVRPQIPQPVNRICARSSEIATARTKPTSDDRRSSCTGTRYPF